MIVHAERVTLTEDDDAIAIEIGGYSTDLVVKNGAQLAVVNVTTSTLVELRAAIDRALAHMSGGERCGSFAALLDAIRAAVDAAEVQDSDGETFDLRVDCGAWEALIAIRNALREVKL